MEIILTDFSDQYSHFPTERILTTEYFSDQIASPFVIDPKKLKEKDVDTIIVEVKL